MLTYIIISECDTIVFDYIKKFCKWKNWEHQVIALVDEKYVSIPANITTVNRLCNQNISNSDEMNTWLKKTQIKYECIDNSEKMGRSRVGDELVLMN